MTSNISSLRRRYRRSPATLEVQRNPTFDEMEEEERGDVVAAETDHPSTDNNLVCTHVVSMELEVLRINQQLTARTKRGPASTRCVFAGMLNDLRVFPEGEVLDVGLVHT